MGDPELRSDESVILRTQGIFVKSIPFEGILTNKRIILVDRAKNLLPQKEIPLVTIKDVEVGENAIRDQIITLSVLAKTGEIRQMILTFSRQTGGNRIRERDAWAKALKENISSSFEQAIRKVIPGRGPAPKKPERTVTPRIEVSSPATQNIPTVMKTTAKKEMDVSQPVNVNETTTKKPAPSSPTIKESNMSVSGFGTYCSRCGNRVPEGSGFCNRCGSPIVVPGSMGAFTTTEKVPQSLKQESGRNILPINTDILPKEPLIDRSAGIIPLVPPKEVPQQPEAPKEPESSASPQETVVSESDSTSPQSDEIPGQEIPDISPSQFSEFMLPAEEPPAPQQPGSGPGIAPGRKTVYRILVIVIIIAAILGGFFLYPAILKGGLTAPKTTASPTAIETTLKPSGTTIIPTVKPAVTVPSEGIYVHIKYLGGWKGSYGMSSALITVTSSGDRYYPVENATGSVEASFSKLDGTTKQVLLVEILKNGSILTSGNTTAGFGNVTLSVDTVTGIAKTPVVSSGATAVISATKTANITGTSTTVATANTTTAKTTVPVNNTTTATQ